MRVKEVFFTKFTEWGGGPEEENVFLMIIENTKKDTPL